MCSCWIFFKVYFRIPTRVCQTKDVLWQHTVFGFVFSLWFWEYLLGVLLPSCALHLFHTPWSWQDLICRMAASVKEQSTKPIPLPQPPPCEWVPLCSCREDVSSSLECHDIWASSKAPGLFSFSSFYRGDNDEEEPAKLKVEHHDLSVAGLQSPGKPHRRVHWV